MPHFTLVSLVPAQARNHYFASGEKFTAVDGCEYDHKIQVGYAARVKSRKDADGYLVIAEEDHGIYKKGDVLGYVANWDCSPNPAWHFQRARAAFGASPGPNGAMYAQADRAAAEEYKTLDWRFKGEMSYLDSWLRAEGKTRAKCLQAAGFVAK